MPEKEKKHEGKERISRREFLGKSLKAGAGVAAASVASKFIGNKYSPHSIFAGSEGKKMEYSPKEGLASGMIPRRPELDPEGRVACPGREGVKG